MTDNKYNYYNTTQQRVGQAVVDILSKENTPIITAGDITEAQSDKYRISLEEAIETGNRIYKSPFYIFVITNKEMWAENVVRNKFIPRQTPPFATHMYQFYPNHMKTLYMVDPSKGHFKICWSIPGVDDIISISKRPYDYHPDLVKWITDFSDGKLDQEKYTFDYDLINDF